MTEKLYSDERQRLVLRLYMLGFKAGVSFDLTAYPVFWWELHQQNADAAAALNVDVAGELYHQVKI